VAAKRASKCCPGTDVLGPFPIGGRQGPTLTTNNADIHAGDTIVIFMTTFVAPQPAPIVTLVGDGFFTATFAVGDTNSYSFYIIHP
jgi:hypothetical protein